MDEQLLEQVKKIALRRHARKLVLFGSRARGDGRHDSDYDFAVWGIASDEQALLLSELDDEVRSLLKLDVVFVSERTDGKLLDSVEREGIVLMDRFETKLENYQSALLRLREGLTAYESMPDKIIRDGVIQRFEFTCELGWKAAREYLLEQGHVDLNSPKAVMRQAYADRLVSDDEGWTGLLTDRNLTSHIYDEHTADEIFQRIQTKYILLLEALIEKLK